MYKLITIISIVLCFFFFSCDGNKAKNSLKGSKSNRQEYKVINKNEFKRTYDDALYKSETETEKANHINNIINEAINGEESVKNLENLYEIINENPKEVSRHIIRHIETIKNSKSSVQDDNKRVGNISFLMKWLGYASSYEEKNLNYLKSAATLNHWKDLNVNLNHLGKYIHEFADDHLAGKAVEYLGYSSSKKSDELLKEIMDNPRVYYQKASFTTSVETALFHKYAMTVYGSKKYLTDITLHYSRETSDLMAYWKNNSENYKEFVPWANRITIHGPY